jgi:polysaccharide biosynthesis transport protein
LPPLARPAAQADGPEGAKPTFFRTVFMSHPVPADPTPPEQPGARALALRNANALRHPLAREDAAPAIEDDGLDLRDLLRVVLKYKWMLLALTLVCGLIAAVQSLRSTPQYSATALVQIDRAAQRVVAFNQDVDTQQDVWDDGSQLQTQIQLLSSRALAERVIDEMGLNRRRAAADTLPGMALGSDTGPLGDNEASAAPANFLDRILSNYRQLNTPAVSDEQALDRNSAVGAFRGSVSIEPVRNSRLVNIVVTNSSPELAARIANTMARTFMAMNLERKLESSTYARGFLEDQIKVTKAKLEESERVINDYAKRNQILTLDDRSEVESQNYAGLSASLARAEEERIKAESVYNEVQRNPESAPQALENRAVQAFKEQRARLEAEYTLNQSILKPEFPKMVQLRSQIDDLNARIKSELNVVVASAKGQFESARQQEALLRERLGQSRAAVQVVQDRSVDLNLLKRELETNRQVYDSLLQRLKEVAVTGGLTTNNISIVDEAKAPLFPFSPQPSRHAAIGMALGLLLGLGLAFLRENLDDSIKHPDELEKLYGLPLLGLIPMVKRKGKTGQVAALVHEDPRSAFAEAYRSMRTALQFSTNEGAPKHLMVTSCGKSEGKTTTSIALAINFAQLGRKVLLIDADMRNPSVHKTMMLPNETGLANFLAGEPGAGTLIQHSNIDNLSVLTAGPTPPDPVELLMGPKLMLLLEKARELGYEQVVIDSPPLLGIADAIVLGNQIPHVVFAIKAGATRRSAIKDAMRRMRHGGIVPMGVVFTHVNDKHGADYGYGTYYGYHADTPTTQITPITQTVKAQEPVFRHSAPSDLMDVGPGPQTMQAKPATGFGAATASPARQPMWALTGGLAGALLVAAVAWWFWPATNTVPAPRDAASQLESDGPAPVATTAAAPALVPGEPAAAQLVATAFTPASETALSPARAEAPPLQTLKNDPEDIWPPLGQLWGVQLDAQRACSSAVEQGLQCFRLLDARLDDLDTMKRPGLVQLKQDGTTRWVLLRSMDAQTVTLRAGNQQWQWPRAAFAQNWSGAYTTLWRLPPGQRSVVNAARANEAAGQWLDEQLKRLQAQQQLPATADSLQARVSEFQRAHQLPGDGKALPTTFLVINRMAGVEEPQL